jgi:hypothetical protein
MTSQGKIVHVTESRVMLIVQHQNGYCLIEMTGNAKRLGIGDVLLGQWDQAGGEVVLRGNEIFDCRFQGTWVSFEEALATARRATGER